MSRRIKTCSIIAGLAALVLSCSEVRRKSFVDEVLDAAIETRSGELAEFPGLYDTLSHYIPEDNEEKLILVEKLKARGFELTNYGRGNFPPLGARVVIVDMVKGDCHCTVRKVYYATVSADAWQMAEAIACEEDLTQSEGAN